MFKVAEWLNIPAPSIVDVGIWWIDKAMNYMSGEAEAEQDIRARQK